MAEADPPPDARAAKLAAALRANLRRRKAAAMPQAPLSPHDPLADGAGDR